MARVAIAYVEVRPDMSGFAEKLHAELAKIHATKTVEIKADVDTRGINKRVTDSVRQISRKAKVTPELDSRNLLRGATDAMRRFGAIFGTGTVGRIINLSIGAAASIIENFSEVGIKSFAKLGEAVFDMAGKFGRFTGVVEKIGLAMVDVGASIVGLAAGFVGAGVAVGVAGIALVAVNVILGATLAIVIPLVGGLTALVAQLVALGGVGTGAMAALPGVLAAAAAAFGPLVLVMEKFQDLFKKTADTVGPLYEMFERLKNAIFAVISLGVVKEFKNLATSVLPLLKTNLIAVAGQWNRLIMMALKFAQTPGAIKAMNTALATGATLLRMFADVMARVGPQLFTMFDKAYPAIIIVADAVGKTVTEFSSLMGALSASGLMSDFFLQIADVVSELLRLVTPLAGLMMAWIGPIIPAAQQFVGILATMLARWVQLASSAGGQQMILNFFLAMNRIVAAFEPLLETVVTLFLQFGPTLASLVEAAIPALQQLLTVFSTLATSMAPGIIAFLEQFSTMLGDPAVLASFTQLGTAVGTLVAAFGGLKPETMTSIVNILASLARLLASLVETTWPLVDAVASVAESLLTLFEPAMIFTQNSITVVVTAMDSLTRKISDVIGWLGKITAPLKSAGDYMKSLADKMGLTSGKSTELATKTKDNTYKISQYFNAMGKATGLVMQDAAGNLTRFANANAWQVIMDNADAAAKAIAQIGQTAFDTQQLQGEKALGRQRQQQKQYAKTASKPPISTKGLSDAWNAGWNSTIDTSVGKANTAAKKTKNAFLTNLTPTLKQVNLMDLIKGGRAYDTGREIAGYLAKGITSGKKNIAKATSIIYKANAANLNKLAGKLKDFASKAATYAGALPKTFAADIKKFTSVAQLDVYLARQQQNWQNVLEEIVAFKQGVREALTPDKGLVGVFGYFPTPAEVRTRFEMQLAEITKFSEGIKALQAKGLDPELARQWLAAGVEGAGNMVQGLQNATEAEVRGISEAYQAVNTEAERVAEEQAVAWKGVGEQTVRGYIDGIQSMRDLVVKEMTTMMTAALAAAKKALKIKSPSAVFDSIGVDTMAGYIQGVDSMATKTVGTVTDMYAAVAAVDPAALTPQVRPSLANTGTLGTVAAMAPANVNVRVYIGDKDLTDLARIVVEDVDSTRARALLAGRRGG